MKKDNQHEQIPAIEVGDKIVYSKGSLPCDDDTQVFDAFNNNINVVAAAHQAAMCLLVIQGIVDENTFMPVTSNGVRVLPYPYAMQSYLMNYSVYVEICKDPVKWMAQHDVWGVINSISNESGKPETYISSIMAAYCSVAGL